MNSHRQLILFIAMSLDGYIAKPNDNLSFLSIVEKPGADYGYADFISTVDTVILGRKTYDWAMKQVDVFPLQEQRDHVSLLKNSNSSPCNFSRTPVRLAN